jgi:hypothetical protein
MTPKIIKTWKFTSIEASGQADAWSLPAGMDKEQGEMIQVMSFPDNKMFIQFSGDLCMTLK